MSCLASVGPWLSAVSLVAMLVAAALVAALAWHRARRGRAASTTLVESLRDEVWELKELAAARERAEAASEAKSRFLATVSHEIRTPLSGIVGLADLLAHGTLDGEQRAYVDSIKTCGAALGSLIDEILDFSKIEAGKLDLAHEPIALAPLVEGVVELLAPRAHGKGLEIAGYVAPDVPGEIMGDAARLRQVLMNLAGNAVKFTEKGGVGVSVVRANDGRIAFKVRDTGIGVPRERQAAIFAEFEQGDTSTTRSHGGTGLGLAISRRLVAHMNGEMMLDSEPAHGSVFSFLIPLAVVAETETGRQPTASGTLQGRSALIVADSIFEAPYIGALLAQAGAEVAYASTRADAHARLGDGSAPDIVLVDCALGQDTVHEVATVARAAGVRHSLVLFSPFERRDFGQESVEGFGGWLVKPVRASSLFARLTDMPDSRRLGPPVATGPAPTQRQGLRVLVAEDDAINALIVRSFLGRLGAEAMHASDGAEALSLAQDAVAGRRAPFGAVVMDINMPELDGREVARRIRQAEAVAGATPMRLVALTANAFSEDRRACLDAGFDTFLVKPVDIGDLAKALAVDEGAAADGVPERCAARVG